MRGRWGALLVAATLGCAGNSPAGQANEWVLLGQRQVNDGADHDVMLAMR